MKTKEVWKDVKNFEGIYQVSNIGRIKSLERYVNHWRGGKKRVNEKIMLLSLDGHGYFRADLSFNGISKTRKVHQLVAESFLNHTPCGFKLVVNHIDFNKQNNNVDNLEIVTNRENSNMKHIKSKSKYVGVTFHTPSMKWCATIWINGKNKHLGYYYSELKASKAYQTALKEINKTNKHSIDNDINKFKEYL